MQIKLRNIEHIQFLNNENQAILSHKKYKPLSVIIFEALIKLK